MKPFLVIIFALVVSGCMTTIQYDEMFFAMTIREEGTRNPVPDLNVYFIHTDPFDQIHRFGPFKTNENGLCVIQIPTRKIKHKGLPFPADVFDFKIYRIGSQEEIVRSIHIAPTQTDVQLEIPANKQA